MPKIIYRVDIYYKDDGEFYDCIETTSEITARNIYAEYTSQRMFIAYMHKYENGVKIY